ncbi:MAG: TIGR00269 family protein [Candidatus Verstraetearchaeota archaeon]|nr:TIGR00269 family protein [Candidatus Verstraetearchaeota archaeon]
MQDNKCRCGREPFYFRRQSGEVLCKRCFSKGIERIVYKTVKREKLFSPEDRIMIALSGGKDSIALAHILSKIEKSYGTDVFAVTIDEGVRGYREEGVAIASDVASRLQIEHHVFTFKEAYGYTLEEICEIAKMKGIQLLGCSFCGILRRRLINRLALKLGATKVATGHNLDDEAQTFLINVFRGDVERIGRSRTKPLVAREGFIPRVKPLRYVPEKEIAIYVYAKGYPLYQRECPYVRFSLRDEIRDVLNRVEENHPGTKHSIVNVSDSLSKLLEERLVSSKIERCKVCGDPSSRKVCRTCEVFSLLGLHES